MNCPNCGGMLVAKEGKMVCEYCGYEEPIKDAFKQSGDAFFNLVLFNESLTGDEISVSLAESNLNFIIRPGEAVAKDVAPGYHTLVVNCAGMTEYRNICAPGDGKATKIYISKGPMGIVIRVAEPDSSPYGQRYGRTRMDQKEVLPIMALIFSLLMPIVGLIFALIDFSNCKKQERNPSGMTKAAFVIVGARVILYILLVSISLIGSFH